MAEQIIDLTADSDDDTASPASSLSLTDAARGANVSLMQVMDRAVGAVSGLITGLKRRLSGGIGGENVKSSGHGGSEVEVVEIIDLDSEEEPVQERNSHQQRSHPCLTQPVDDGRYQGWEIEVALAAKRSSSRCTDTRAGPASPRVRRLCTSAVPRHCSQCSNTPNGASRDGWGGSRIPRKSEGGCGGPACRAVSPAASCRGADGQGPRAHGSRTRATSWRRRLSRR